jgi:glycosyltransferase involved in cell wall biosynthesis
LRATFEVLNAKLFQLTLRLSNKLLEMAVVRGRIMTERRLAKGRPRAVWGVTPIVTVPVKARCDRLIGIDAESLVFTTYYINKNFDWNLKILIRAAFWLNPNLVGIVCRLTLAAALLRYDVFHYFNDRGILVPPRQFGIAPEELQILRRAGKRLYVFTYGADIRTRQRTLALGRWNFCTDCPSPGTFCVCDENNGIEQMAITLQSANAVVTLGDMIAYVPGGLNLPYWPIDTDAIAFAGVRQSTGVLKIAHAPNHPHFKGTAYLESAIEKLRAEGLPIELVRVQGVPNRDVLRLFAAVDIVADQFIGGAYGYTALEAMACGKPVLCYVRNTDMLLAPQKCPLIQTTPETIEDVLRWCVVNRDRLAAIGRQGRNYVEKYHSVEAVAARLARLYLDTANFPPNISERLERAIREDAVRQTAFVAASDWHHPFAMSGLPPGTGPHPASALGSFAEVSPRSAKASP